MIPEPLAVAGPSSTGASLHHCADGLESEKQAGHRIAVSYVACSQRLQCLKICVLAGSVKAGYFFTYRWALCKPKPLNLGVLLVWRLSLSHWSALCPELEVILMGLWD